MESSSKFKLEENTFDKLYSQRKDRYFQRGNYCVKGMNKSNPFCVFSFQHHHLSVAVRRKTTGKRIFFATAMCKFSTCPVKATLEMFDRQNITVTYTGNVNHIISEQHCRYIRDDERAEIKEKIKTGIKHLTKYLDLVEKHTPEELVFGIVDGVGKNSRVCVQIACESQ